MQHRRVFVCVRRVCFRGDKCILAIFRVKPRLLYVQHLAARWAHATHGVSLGVTDAMMIGGKQGISLVKRSPVRRKPGIPPRLGICDSHGLCPPVYGIVEQT